MAHLCDIIEARGMIDVEKLLDFCNKHIQFYILSKYLYDMMGFFQIYNTWEQKLDLIAYSSFKKLKLNLN